MPTRLDHDQVQRQVHDALGELLRMDAYLLLNDLSERSIAFRLGLYLQRGFRTLSVDCEYNRTGTDPKFVDGLQHRLWPGCPNYRRDGRWPRAFKVYPDIIVHKRGEGGPNLLALELKKTSNRRGCRDCDIEKLTAYLEFPLLRYDHAAFLELETGAPGVKRLEWICH